MGSRVIDARDSDLPGTVLVVEDEVVIRWVIAEHLRDCGYRVIEAGSGDEAIEILQRTALTVDVVFTDVQMPGSIDGFALAQWVRRQRPAIKIVLTSGIAKATDAAHALCDEASLVPKPYKKRSKRSPAGNKRSEPAAFESSCASCVLFESILRAADHQKGFRTTKTRNGSRSGRAERW